MQPVLFVITAFVIQRIQGYGTGAPQSKCGDMFPLHSRIQPENGLPPYTLTASSYTYKQGDTITVTLASPTGASFAGYILGAKDQTTLNSNLGRFTNTATGRTLSCGTSGAGAVTHQNSQPEYQLQFQWQPTADTTGNVVFIATVVESYSTFWLNIVTSTIYPEVQTTQASVVQTPKVPETTTQPVTESFQPTTITTSTTRTTTIMQTTKTSILPGDTSSLKSDSECGATKGCFIDCTGNSCNYIVTWRDNGDAVDFELSTKLQDTNNKWIAIAFSSDIKMGGDEVVACFNVGGSTDVQRSYNDGKINTQVTNPSAGLSNTVVTVQDGMFKCSFRKNKRLSRRKRQTTSSLFVDLDNDYNLMFGTGPAYPGNKIGMHSINPVVTPGKVDFQSFTVIGDTAKYPLVKIHACLMIISWIFCTGVAIIAARYYKPVWSKSSLFNQKIWFQIHRTLMVTAMTLTIVAFIIIFVEVGGYSQVSASPGKEYLPSHPVLGIIVTILCILNPIMSFFRPGPNDKTRPIFNWAHWGVGMLAQILAIITIIFGVDLQKSTAPKYTVWVVVGFVIYYVIMEITQKVVDRLAERKTGEAQIDTVEMKQNGSQNGSFNANQPPAYSEDNKNKKDTLLKKSLLALHGICTLAFTFTLLLLVSMY
ncbi:putative ferric-chelate reductase 1 homolog [Mytilus californianus]|uniref:putative ferric-chelate reductase 1 homolog n=1 Tax=Mytilus californianus TaxID=6549 RepID=UPI0022454545|nr:putative ferric-chelate reductase 1 homolog [Mytilus californianus]